MTTERSHDLKFDKGTIYTVYYHTHVHAHIDKMGIYQNLSSNCTYVITSCVHVRNLLLGANVHPGANLLHRIAPPTKVEQICTRVHFHNTPFI